MNKNQKIAQLFSPAAFIHDTEENYQVIEALIREQEIGGLTFFHSRHSAAAMPHGKRRCARSDRRAGRLR